MSSKKRRSDVTTEIVVGAFMFVILVVLLTLTLVISQNRFFERAYFLDVHFENIGGLRNGEPVFMRGVQIGNVNEINVPSSGRGVNLKLRLTRSVELHEDYRFIIEPSSMLGGMRLLVDEGSESRPLLPEEGYAALKGQPVTNLLDEATQTIHLIREALVDGGILEDIQGFTGNLRAISEKVDQGEGTIARLINDSALHDQLLALTENFNEVSADAKRVFSRIEQGEGTVGKLLSSDAQLYEDLSATIAGLREFTERLTEEQGTLTLLMTEDVLYRKVESLVDEARATLDDFRETSPITTFSSIFFGAF
ncbi:MAG: MCE family protein [Verrucomicrobia bacterium]|nr:MCE family protein [Verrucomicrobiota bacterium]MCH8526528.1 MlaD family protein [Kiritimatiellia bacterium]